MVIDECIIAVTIWLWMSVYNASDKNCKENYEEKLYTNDNYGSTWDDTSYSSTWDLTPTASRNPLSKIVRSLYICVHY